MHYSLFERRVLDRNHLGTRQINDTFANIVLGRYGIDRYLAGFRAADNFVCDNNIITWCAKNRWAMTAAAMRTGQHCPAWGSGKRVPVDRGLYFTRQQHSPRNNKTVIKIFDVPNSDTLFFINPLSILLTWHRCGVPPHVISAYHVRTIFLTHFFHCQTRQKPNNRHTDSAMKKKYRRRLLFIQTKYL